MKKKTQKKTCLVSYLGSGRFFCFFLPFRVRYSLITPFNRDIPLEIAQSDLADSPLCPFGLQLHWCCSSTGPLEEVHECFVWGNPVPHIFSVIALKRPLRVFGRTAIGSPYKIYVHHTKHSCTSSRGPVELEQTKRAQSSMRYRLRVVNFDWK